MNPISKFSDQYRFLSNFYPCKITEWGLVYPSAEHFYQSKKTVLMNEKLMVINCETAGRAKRLGRKITLRPDWEDIKLIAMYGVVSCKFYQNEDLLQKLLETEDSVLIEGNEWHDTFWGKCYCRVHEGDGKNNLGKLLMDLRDEINNNRL